MLNPPAVSLDPYHPYQLQSTTNSKNNNHNSTAATTTTTTTNLTTSSDIPFRWLLGEFHWKRRFAQLYRAQQGQWLTPIEVFKPFYSQVLARYVASVVLQPQQLQSGNDGTCTINDDNQQQEAPPPPLSIIELGGGRGTNAICMMDFLEQTFPHLYATTHYTIVDASPTLSQLQHDNVLNSRHATKIQLVHQDLVPVGEGHTNLLNESINNRSTQTKTTSDNTVYFILGLELLDNLPHCKIRVRNTAVEQAELVRVGSDEYDDDVDEEESHLLGTKKSNNSDRRQRRPMYSEVFAPLSDPLLKEILRRAPIYKRVRGAAWIPSIACGLLQSIAQQFHNHHCHILLADFDWLPPADTTLPELALSFPAEGQPLVTDMNDVDHACYLLPTDTPTDILFPTNFDKLAVFCKNLFDADSSTVTIQKQADFLRTHGCAEIQATSSWFTGYSPLIHDYRNCSVLQISSTPTTQL